MTWKKVGKENPEKEGVYLAAFKHVNYPFEGPKEDCEEKNGGRCCE